MNRAFRLTFNHTAGKFVIEIQGFAGLSWKAVKEGNKVRYFDTFSDANTYVKRVGLNQVYSDFTFQRPYGSPKIPPSVFQKVDYTKPIGPQNERIGPVMWV